MNQVLRTPFSGTQTAGSRFERVDCTIFFDNFHFSKTFIIHHNLNLNKAPLSKNVMKEADTSCKASSQAVLF